MNQKNDKKTSSSKGDESDEKSRLEKERQSTIAEHLEMLDKYLTDWELAEKNNETVLTKDQIKFLGILAEKNLKNKDGKVGLSNAQQKMKGYVRAALRNAISDIDRMVQYGFIGTTGPRGELWDPRSYDNNTNRPPFDPASLKEDFPVQKVATFIEALVGMYGVEYAKPFVDAIERGLQANEGQDPIYDVEVKIIKTTR